MDPRLLRLYDQELTLLRGMGAEFAELFPKIAGRLGMERLEVADPYVERLLEGFGFMAARVRLKIESEFPRFTQHLLENVYPHYLAPMPSMAVAQFHPDPAEGDLSAGFEIERGSRLRSVLGRGEDTACEYRTAHPVTLWPIEVSEASYVRGGPARLEGPREFHDARAALQIRLRSTAGLPLSQLSLSKLPLYLKGEGDVPSRLYELLLGHSLGMTARPVGGDVAWVEPIRRREIRPLGFDDDHALLPYGRRSFQGYRLLEEYFHFAERFMFVELGGLERAISRCTGTEIELHVLLDRLDNDLEAAVAAGNFELFCSPVVNLFEKRSDRINLNDRSHEHHVVADRTRPMDYEIHTIQNVTGFGSGQREQEFRPFYRARDRDVLETHRAYYTVRREPRLASSQRQRTGGRSGYIGSETYISLVDSGDAPYSSDLREMSVTALCTNRDLPILMQVGRGATDFKLDTGAPVESIRCLAGPTKPKPSRADGSEAWRLVNHLSLNHLSLVDEEADGAAALRSLLMLYGDDQDADVTGRVGGVISVNSKPVTRRLVAGGTASFQRGLHIEIVCDETPFNGFYGVFLAGAVLAQFFARYVSINSFTETLVSSTSRGEVMRWPATPGRRLTL